MSEKKHTLFVKNLPPGLNREEKIRLFELFGAKDIRIMPDLGRFKNSAFVTFASSEDTKEALTRLHQLEILDYVLCVEFAKKSHDSYLKIDTDNEGRKSEEQKKSEDSKEPASKISKRCKFCQRLPPVAPEYGLEYPLNPGLKYLYPEPNSNILLNICAALVTVPKFYTQVLHLMNKLNMFCPFSPATNIPPILVEHIKHSLGVETFDPAMQYKEDIETINDESEYESSEDERKGFNLDILPPEKIIKTLKRKQKSISKSPRRKLARFKDPDTHLVSASHNKISSEEPFEKFDTTAGKSITMKLPLTMENPDNFVQSDIANEDDNTGFGRIMPKHQEESSAENQGSGDYNVSFDFMTRKQLESGRLSSKEMSSNSLFTNYRPGEPSCRLYIKNLSKKATDKDIRYIFGGFIDFNNEEEANMFDVRVMTQGRMKGQAFVGMPSIEKAKQALKCVNGYQLIGKPMVVLYARSAKPKNDDV